jgi:hypothetical protein
LLKYNQRFKRMSIHHLKNLSIFSLKTKPKEIKKSQITLHLSHLNLKNNKKNNLKNNKSKKQVNQSTKLKRKKLNKVKTKMN